jgi:hypothetical protein
MLEFKTLNAYVTFFAVVLSVVVSLYAFVPQVLATLSPINEEQVARVLRDHDSFAKDRNIKGMLSVYHPDFSMEVIHSTGRKETFNKSQITKHQENINLIASLELKDISQQISMVNNNEALVSVVMQQDVSIKGLPAIKREFLYQAMIITKYEGEPRILKVLSVAK